MPEPMDRIFDKLHRFFWGKWQLGVLDKDAGRWIVKPESKNIAYLKAENANGRHILVQPTTGASYYLLVDDVSWDLIQRQHKNNFGLWRPGRMVVETSPENYQVWIHSSRPLSMQEKRFWLKKLKSDPGAAPNNRWGRCPGFRNRKEKYRDCNDRYPLSKLVWVDFSRLANIPTTPGSLSIAEHGLSPQPQEGGVCLAFNIFRSAYQRNDESATDFGYAMALLRRGCPPELVHERILNERKNWKNHMGPKRIKSYLDRTINRAKNIIDRS